MKKFINWFAHKLDYNWLMDNMSCKRFAKHVATKTESLGSPYRWFHFWLHWTICPFCRQYWNEMKTIGAEAKKIKEVANHPIVKINEVKDRLRAKLQGGVR